mmetsp:Transcript_96272/g.254265  ORF Transcript_96272/g.254265 Transcript_96272/m.254265 type:complete len:233 (-) Transcript_96272:423-1121(-)
MNPHGRTGNGESIPRGQRSPQLGFLIHVCLEVHMDAVSQDETSVSEHIVKVNRFGLRPNSVQAWPVLHTEGEVESTHTCGRCLLPNALIAWELHEQELWPIGPLIEGRQVNSRGIRPPSEFHRLGPRKPPEPVAMDHIGVRGPPLPLIAHDRVVEVIIEFSGLQVTSCMMHSPRVPDLVDDGLPGLSCVVELGKPVPPAAGRGISSGHEEVPRCKHQRVSVGSSADLCLVRR